jgi:hypothetical protein
MAPEEVRPHGAADGVARVLREHQPVERPARERPGGGDVDRRTERHDSRVDRHAATCCQRHAERADRPGQAGGQLAEKHVARVVVEQLRQLVGVCASPCLDALHRGFLQRQLAALYQVPADRAIGEAVVIGVTDAQRLSVVERDATRALDLQEEELDRVLHPRDFPAGERRASLPDLRAIVIGHDAPAVDTPSQPQTLKLGICLGQVDFQEIVGHAIDGVAIARSGPAAAAELRLVVSRDQPLVAAVGAQQLEGREVHLEKTPRRLAVRAAHARGYGADVLPRSRFSERAAARLERRPRLPRVLRLPFRKIAPGCLAQRTRLADRRRPDGWSLPGRDRGQGRLRRKGLAARERE